MTFELFSDTVDSYDGVLSEERVWSDAARTARMMHAHRGGRVGAMMRCATRHALGLTARRAPQEGAGARLPYCADGTARGGAAGSASDPRAGEAGPPARALGSHTRADPQPHAVVDRQQRRYHHAACEPAFPLGAGTEPER